MSCTVLCRLLPYFIVRYDSAETGWNQIDLQARSKWNRLRSIPAVAPQMKKRS